jgi:hypothetical protein
MSVDRSALWAVTIVAVVMAMGAVHRLWPRATSPAQRDPQHAELWMADALPGVGAKTREAALESVREGHHERLPKAAQLVAQQVFTAP